MKRFANRLAHFAGKILVLETALLLVIALVWRWTDWHTTDSLGVALTIVGGAIIGIGLLALTTRGSSHDMKLREAQMLSPDYKGQHQFTPMYAKSTRVWFWLISLGIMTIGVGIVFNVFIP